MVDFMEKLEKKDQHKNLILAMKVGSLLTASGAEIRRVETTMERIIESEEGSIAHVNCTPGSVTATVTYAQGDSKTMILRILNKSTDFKKIIRLNELSRKYTNTELTYDEAMFEFENIQTMRMPPLYLRSMLNGLCCSAFTFIISPTLGDVISSLIIGVCAMMLSESMYSKVKLTDFMQTLVTSSIITIMTFIICGIGIGNSANYIIVGSVTPLLPGVETVNAVRDIVESDYLSAVSRILNAVLFGSALAVGVGVVYLLVRYIGV